MSSNIVVGFAFIFAGALIGFAGYLIRFKHRLELIAGYDPKQIKDKEGLGRWVGNGILAIGVVELVSGLITVLIADLLPVMVLVFFFATVLVPLFLLTRISRFTK